MILFSFIQIFLYINFHLFKCDREEYLILGTYHWSSLLIEPIIWDSTFIKVPINHNWLLWAANDLPIDCYFSYEQSQESRLMSIMKLRRTDNADMMLYNGPSIEQALQAYRPCVGLSQPGQSLEIVQGAIA